MRLDFHESVLGRIKGLFDRPIIQNDLRGLYVEAMIAELLAPEWKQTANWAGWDFEHEGGAKLEVKQSAFAQSWDREIKPMKSRGTFSIRSVTGFYEGDAWHKSPGRQADAYVFAWHGFQGSQADQRDIKQWEFYVAPETALPDQKTITLGKIRQLCRKVTHDSLKSAIETFGIKGEFA